MQGPWCRSERAASHTRALFSLAADRRQQPASPELWQQLEHTLLMSLLRWCRQSCLGRTVSESGWATQHLPQLQSSVKAKPGIGSAVGMVGKLTKQNISQMYEMSVRQEFTQQHTKFEKLVQITWYKKTWYKQMGSVQTSIGTN